MTTHQPPRRGGYLAATVGGVTGTIALGGAGVAVGLATVERLSDPSAGLANLGLLLWPIVLGAAGLAAGMFAGTAVGLGVRGHPRAVTTAAVATLLTGGAIAAVGILPFGPALAVLLAACPAAAHRAVGDGPTPDRARQSPPRDGRAD